MHVCERLPPLSLSEEVHIGASVLRADTVAASALGITRLDVVTNDLDSDWSDGVVTVCNGIASVTEQLLARVTYGEGLALAC